MKLYLSSYRIPKPDELFALLGKSPIGLKVAIIPNARDYKLPQERAESLDESIYSLAQLGFITEIVDLREYEDGEILMDKLKDFEIIWVAGGNTFILRSEMKRSGFDKIISPILDNGTIYCGESAGAIVAGKTLKGAEVADEPELADEIIWDGLGLVDKIIIPHADSVEFREYVAHMKQIYKDDNQTLFINDNQAFIVNE